MERNVTGEALQRHLHAALAAQLPAYRQRDAQFGLIDTAQRLLSTSGKHVLCAPDMFGKSFALLLAAALCEHGVVISVSSVALSHKLQSDWLDIRNAGLTTKTLAVLSSRRNQLCPSRLSQQTHRRDVATKAQAMVQWYQQTGSRELALCPLLAEDDALLQRVSCTGTRCERALCASDVASSADILVVTHAWLLAQKKLPGFITSRRLVVDDADGLAASAGEQAAQTLDIAFWFGQRSAFETWLSRYLALESDLLRPYLEHLCALMRRLDESSVIEPILLALRDSVTVFMQAFAQLCEARGIRVSEPVAWLDYCRFYLRWFETYARRDNPLYAIARKHERDGAGWVCRIENASHEAALATTLGAFKSAVLLFSESEIAASVKSLAASTDIIHGDAAALTRVDVAPLEGLAADMNELQRMQCVAALLRKRIEHTPVRWLLLVTQRTQVERYRGVLAGERDVLYQGDQSKTVLLKRFSSMQRGILVATWQMVEGWDFGEQGIAGAVLDRLPLVIEKEIAGDAQSRDKAHFVDAVVPRAQKTLRRIATMLVRREHQHAHLWLADTRLLTHAWADTIAAAFHADLNG